MTIRRNTTVTDGKKTATSKPRFNRRRYVELLAAAAPRVITNGEELERVSRLAEPLLFREGARTPEEEAFLELLLKLIDDYQTQHSLIPRLKPHELLQAILAEAGLRQADLLDIFGSRSRVSEAVNGKRPISKVQAEKLGARFCVFPDAFI